MPQNSNDIIAPTLHEMKRLTPSISDPSVIEDEMDILDYQERSRLSPSPEVDLSSPELDHGLPKCPPTPGESFSGRSSLNPDGILEYHSRPNRAPSPPLEADEKGFTETATAVRARGMSLHESQVQVSIEVEEQRRPIETIEETPEIMQRRDQELGYELFGQMHSGLGVPSQKVTSSPMMQPRHDHMGVNAVTKLNLSFQQDDVEMGDVSWSVMSPESIEVDELDGLFSGF